MQKIHLKQNIIELLKFNDIENIDVSSIQHAKKHIWHSRTYNNEKNKEKNDQSKEFKNLSIVLDILNKIQGKLKNNPNHKEIDIEKELAHLRELAKKSTKSTIENACRKICPGDGSVLLQFDDIKNIDVFSIATARNHIQNSHEYKRMKKNGADEKDENFRNYASALNSLDNIKGKLKLSSDTTNIDIEKELKILRQLAKGSKVIRTACEKVHLIQEIDILQFDDIENIDVSSIDNARKHLWNTPLYRDRNHKQDIRLENIKSALDSLNNIKGKKRLNPDKKDINIKKELEILRELAKKSSLIKEACEKVHLIQGIEILQFDDIENIDVPSIANAEKHIIQNKLYRSIKRSEKDKNENDQEERYKYYSSSLRRFGNLKSKILERNYLAAKEDIEILRELAKKLPLIKAACEKIKCK